jgi:hypothetical protein
VLLENQSDICLVMNLCIVDISLFGLIGCDLTSGKTGQWGLQGVCLKIGAWGGREGLVFLEVAK